MIENYIIICAFVNMVTGAIVDCQSLIWNIIVMLVGMFWWTWAVTVNETTAVKAAWIFVTNMRTEYLTLVIHFFFLHEMATRSLYATRIKIQTWLCVRWFELL